MIPLFVLGINHDSASVEVRERVAFSPELIEVALQSLVEQTSAVESAIMSTCNRTELYVVVDQTVQEPLAINEILEWLANHHGLELSVLESCYYHRTLKPTGILLRVGCVCCSWV